MNDDNMIEMPATEALEIASTYFTSFATKPLNETMELVEKTDVETLCNHVAIIGEVIERFMDIHMALQIQLQDMGYTVEVKRHPDPPKLVVM